MKTPEKLGEIRGCLKCKQKPAPMLAFYVLKTPRTAIILGGKLSYLPESLGILNVFSKYTEKMSDMTPLRRVLHRYEARFFRIEWRSLVRGSATEVSESKTTCSSSLYSR